MSLVADDAITLFIPDKTDAKNIPTSYRKVYITGCRVESIKSSELTDLGLDDTKGITVYYIFKYGRAISNNVLDYIEWKTYRDLTDEEKLKYWTVNDINCLVIRGKHSINMGDTYQDIQKKTDVYTIRSINEQRIKGKIHHIEMVGV